MTLDARLREEMGRLAEEHARALAPPTAGDLRARLDALERSLATTYERLGRARYAPGERPAAVEWLLDNGHVIQDAIAQVRRSLPRGFVRTLPTLRYDAPAVGAADTNAPAPGRRDRPPERRRRGRPYPRLTRTEALAAFVTEESGAALDLEGVAALLDAYQATTALSVGELWAFPALLRLTVLEMLAPAASAAVGRGASGGPGVDAGPGGHADSEAGAGPATPAADAADTCAPQAPAEAAPSPVPAAVRALRALAAHDWKAFVERCSCLERLLREDPSGDYPRMDFTTRDRYRNQIEDLARRSAGRDELDIARAALRLAEAAPADSRARHVGCYLIAEGRPALEATIGYAHPLRLRLGRALAPRAPTLYIGGTLATALAALALPIAWLSRVDAPPVALAGALACGFVPAWTLAASLVEWLVTLLVPARRIPRMDAEEGVPASARTLVVMPVILRDARDAGPLLERLEINYLGNRDPRITFALLTDLADADAREAAGDAAIVAALSDGVRRLNERYGEERLRPFHLLHRERRWNPVERLWMGWERKRGKLEELGALITGRGATSFVLTVDAPDDLQRVRYVVTLDADTRLAPGAARELIAAFRHPLVRAVVDPATHVLRAGYTVLQPRLESDAAVALETAFGRVMTGESGIDLYAQLVSNAYHDLFGQAIFMGKGIYDVDAFDRLLRGRVPENRLLSHDLFEGVHGRVGLISDVVLFEQHPANALLHAQRLHRWVRGDWQLLSWVVARRPPGRDGPAPVGLPALARWQMADNLRRSLQLPSLLALLTGAWASLPASGAAVATVAVLTLSAAPVPLATLTAVLRGLAGRAWRPMLAAAGTAARLEAARWALWWVLTPHLTLVTLHAVACALYRTYVSRRLLLQWTSAAHAAHALGATVGATAAARRMGGALLLTLALAAGVAVAAPASLPAALPLLLAWTAAPAVVAWTSRPTVRPRELLPEAHRRALRLLARRTWHFFADLVGPRDHWLPPDHLQEDPGPMVAHRTSPTNIGMMLTSTLAAYDLGFLEARTLADRVRETLDTLDRLERYRGHWLNWIGTRELNSLPPKYVSTVDSGNLAVALLVLARGLDDARRDGVPYPARLRGLADTVGVLDDIVARLRPRLAQASDRRALDPPRATLGAVEASLRDAAPRPLAQRRAALVAAEAELRRVAEALATALEAGPVGVTHDALAELRAWLEQAVGETRAAREEIDASVPWLPLAAAPPARSSAAGAASADATAPTLQHLTEALAAPLDLGEVHELAERCRSLVDDLNRQLDAQDAGPERDAARRWGAEVLRALGAAIDRAAELDTDLRAAAARCREAVAAMDFAFLYDPARRLFHIGYHVAAGHHDANHYDLLASEARTASLLAIAKGDAPPEHWLHLGRPLARVRGARVLLSWSATMFEYLMPRLFLRHPERTLLHESCHAALAQQIAFAQRHGVPWGISESAFAELGTQGDYQYRAFGVPGVGLKRDLGRRLVVAPYASALALPLRPRQAMVNIERLVGLGAMGRYGLIDAIDFGDTVDLEGLGLIADRRRQGSRLRRWRRDRRGPPPARRPQLVRTYMAHHQGMVLVAATNQLLRDRMVERLHDLPEIASVELLLHERIPVHVPAPSRWRRAEAAAAEPGAEAPVAAHAWDVEPRGPIDRAMPLSNGATTAVLRAAGGGGTHWGGIALTRDQPHDSGGARGTIVYLRDLDDGDTWSITLDPTGGDPSEVAVSFEAHRVRYRRRRAELLAREDVVVADHEALELRRVSVTNEGTRPRRLALASYAEVVLGSAAEDARHPAFAKMFIESAASADLSTLTFRRRHRAPGERTAVLAHRLLLDPDARAARRACCDRRAFLGRPGAGAGAATASAAALGAGPGAQPTTIGGGDLRAPLAPTLAPGTGDPPPPGATLDPIASLGCSFELAPDATFQATFVTASGWSDEALEAALRRAATPARAAQLTERAREAAGAELHALGLRADDLAEFADLLSLALAPRAGLRADGLEAAGPVLPALWSQGVSGDLPIVLVRVADEGALPFVVRLLRAHAWWRGRQVGIDLLLFDLASSGYDQPMRDRLEQAIADVTRLGRSQGPGRAVVVAGDRGDGAASDVLAAAAVVLDAPGPPLAAQLVRATDPAAQLPAFVPVPGPQPPTAEIAPLPPLAGGAFGPWGGYAGEFAAASDAAAAADGAATPGGRAAAGLDADDVLLHLEPGKPTPAPWINVVANDHFGFLVSERGAGTTWGANSGERRLTPWPNDPVRDPSGEALYLRDEETGAVWSPTPSPAPSGAAYRVRHGAGATSFVHHAHGLEQELTLSVDPEAPVKLLTLRLRDRWDRPRRLTVTAYVEWVLGTLRARQAPFLVPAYDPGSGALLARTLLGPMAEDAVAFLVASRPPHGLTTDRREFLGAEGDPARPAALRRVGLSGSVRAGLDPCAALQVHVDLPPGGSDTVHFALGLAADGAEALALARRFRDRAEGDASRARSDASWRARFGRIVVRTPDVAVDRLLNRWLPYQALACRLWGRTALYQSSGAFGFRDQLQDATNLAPLEPALARAQLLRAAERQFDEGDVLHWWHPDTGAGVRTRCSDDLLWLPWALARYLQRSGDDAVLHERVPFLRAPPLAADEHERYDRYRSGPADGTLLEHALRALERGDTRGPHGLPLIGANDWNDGMSGLGLAGRGESVWLGWFVCVALEDGAWLCERAATAGLGPPAAWAARAARYRERRAALEVALARHAWDGAWYLRAIADDGTPIGSHARAEAQIDLIAQAWAVLSGAADPARAGEAMASARARLWRRDDGLLLLLAPPFEREAPDPGYIRAYPRGVRENGGQYTHGAVWGAWALADLGDGDAAVELLRSLGSVGRARDPAAAERYRVEPYVVAADVYGAAPFVGRGGWTWYTGAAAWLYRFGLERVLGVRLRADALELDPCIARAWRGYTVTFGFGAARYEVAVENPDGVCRGVAAVTLDGEPVALTPAGAARVPLHDDGRPHRVGVRLGAAGGG